jgi:hypothetical protein
MKTPQGARQMLTKVQAYRLVPWAWSAAWLLTGAGVSISDIYSYPSRSLFAYVALSAMGWGAAGFITANAASGKPGLRFRLAAWTAAYLAYLILGLKWGLSWNGGYWGPIAAAGVAGVLGGVASSMRGGAWRWVSAALVGVVFLLFSTASFYAGYFLILISTSIAQHNGNPGILYDLVWALPGALCGLGAGFAARRILGLKRGAETGDSPG